MSGRKKTLILCIAILGAGALWVSVRWKHFVTLTGSKCVDEWTHEDAAWFWRQPVTIDLNEEDCDPEAVGAALEHYASVRRVTLRRNTGKWLDGLFSKW